jgi:hypothetical protein
MFRIWGSVGSVPMDSRGVVVVIRKGKYPNASDNFKTDLWILDMFADFYDPCPYNPHFEHCGLREAIWPEKVFINPPYSNVTPWIKRAIEHQKAGGFVVMLLKHDSSTKWFQLIHEAGGRILMFGNRLKHQTNNHASFPSILVVFSND